MSKEEIKVSVCVITYNQDQYISKCLDSLISQKVDFSFEIIVGDDCSTDNTKKILKNYQEKYPGIIKLIQYDKNVGVVENYRRVHALAQGQYICHVDGDDYWLQGKMAYQARLLDENPDVVQCWTCAYLIDDIGNKKGVFPSRVARFYNPKKIKVQDIALSYALVGHHSTQMYRRIVRKPELLNREFLDYWVAFLNALEGNTIYSKEILSVYRLGEIESVTRNASKNKVSVDLLSEHLIQIVKDYPQYAEEAKANMIVRKLISTLRGHDTTVIRGNLMSIRYVKTNIFLIVKSLFYFILQKLP